MNRGKFLRVDVGGKDENLWQKLRPKLVAAITNFLDFTIDHENSSTIRDEARKFTTALLDYGKAYLEKPVLENHKVAGEVELLFSQAQVQKAEARIKNAEAAEKEFNLALAKMKVALGGAKVLMLGEAGEEEIAFIKQIDAYLTVINSIEGTSQNALPG